MSFDKRALEDGTTSACAENTPASALPGDCGGNYLRVRGEYCFTSGPGVSLRELPPRARRIHYSIAYEERYLGTTSACAENTLARHGYEGSERNYLRVRGEYTVDQGK